MNVAESKPEPPLPKLRWYQYRLETLFLITTFVAILMPWVPGWLARYREWRDPMADEGPSLSPSRPKRTGRGGKGSEATTRNPHCHRATASTSMAAQQSCRLVLPALEAW